MSKKTSSDIQVLQFGEGNFLRGFADWMIEKSNQKRGANIGVHVIKPRPGGSLQQWEDQQGNFHVITQGVENGERVEKIDLITCVQAWTHPHENYEEFLESAHQPGMQVIISNTTEAGLYFDEKDKSAQQCPMAFPGKLCAWLWERFQQSTLRNKDLLVLPCELIENNGEKLRALCKMYAQYWALPSDYLLWLSNHVLFCNSLVDRIVPGRPCREPDFLPGNFSFSDQLMVQVEPYYLWVIEGSEKAKKLWPLAEAGLNVRWAEDLNDYRKRKVRILNGAHSLMVPLAYFSGHATVKSFIDDPEWNHFILTFLNEEVVPCIEEKKQGVEGKQEVEQKEFSLQKGALDRQELEAFALACMDRFSNPYLEHQFSSIALNGLSKFKVRLLPTLLEYQKNFNALPHRLCKGFAALLMMYSGASSSLPYSIPDNADLLVQFSADLQGAKSPGDFVQKILSNQRLWDQDLNQIPGLFDLLKSIIEDSSYFNSLARK